MSDIALGSEMKMWFGAGMSQFKAGKTSMDQRLLALYIEHTNPDMSPGFLMGLVDCKIMMISCILEHSPQ
jgi:hypothetical protein